MRHWLAVLIAASLAIGSLEAQGLGEAAAKEKRRREEEQKKNKGPARVITTEDLEKVTATTANTGTAANVLTPTLAQDLGGRPSSEADADSSRPRVLEDGTVVGGVGGKDEKAWRNEFAQFQQELQAAEEKVRHLEQESGRVFGGIQRSTDTNELLRLRAEQTELTDQLNKAKGELADARQALADFQERARRAGVPPGWIR